MHHYRQNDLRSLISKRNQIGYLRVDAAEGSDDGEHAEWVDGELFVEMGRCPLLKWI
jgi:hypothetical protein